MVVVQGRPWEQELIVANVRARGDERTCLQQWRRFGRETKESLYSGPRRLRDCSLGGRPRGVDTRWLSSILRNGPRRNQSSRRRKADTPRFSLQGLGTWMTRRKGAGWSLVCVVISRCPGRL